MNSFTNRMEDALQNLNLMHSECDDLNCEKAKGEIMGDYGLSEQEWALVLENSTYPNA